MGNTWARYVLLDPGGLEGRFLHHPETVTEDGWRSLVAQQGDRDLPGYPVERPLLLNADPRLDAVAAPEGGTGRLLNTPEAARVVLEACRASCGRHEFKAADVCSAFWDGADLMAALDPTHRPALKVLWSLLGFPGRPPGAPIPWWLKASYGVDHWAALTEPAHLRDAVAQHLRAGFFTALLAALREVHGNPGLAHAAEGLGAFLALAEATPLWLLAVESSG